MMHGIGGGIRAADGSKVSGKPDVIAPRLDFRRKGPRKREVPKRPMPEKKVSDLKAKRKRRPPVASNRFRRVLDVIIERIKLFWEWLKPHLTTTLRIAGSREFIVVAVLFFAYAAGFVLWQQYLNILVYILPGIVASAVIYKILSDLREERDKIQKEKDRLKLLEDRSRVLLENALDCVFTLDLQGNITSFNRKSERVTGYLKKDVLGQSFGMFLSREGIKDFFDKLQKAISTGTVPMYELEINTIYGKRNFEMNLTAIKIRDRLIGVQGIGRDITDRKRLEKELKMATSDLERWSKRTVKKEMTILEMKNQIKTIKRELDTYSAGNN
jgi:PAS domain S-box-containing protein